MNYKYILFLMIVSLFSCTEYQTVTDVEHINQTVTGNEPAPYEGVTTTQIQGYVNRVYIDLIGREPNTDELTNWTTHLKNSHLSDESRGNLINTIQGNLNYYQRFFEIYSGQLLGGVTSDDIQGEIAQYQNFQANALINGDTLDAQILGYRITLIQNIVNADSDYMQGNITINQFFQRMIFNPIFEDINMGAENFVLACFEGLFKRYPTTIELDKSVDIVNGSTRTLLQSDGSSKEDFVQIMTTVPAFYEGLTIELYRQLLARNPSSIEMGQGTLELTTTGTYQTLQKEVMKMDEYAGF